MEPPVSLGVQLEITDGVRGTPALGCRATAAPDETRSHRTAPRIRLPTPRTIRTRLAAGEQMLRSPLGQSAGDHPREGNGSGFGDRVGLADLAVHAMDSYLATAGVLSKAAGLCVRGLLSVVLLETPRGSRRQRSRASHPQGLARPRNPVAPSASLVCERFCVTDARASPWTNCLGVAIGGGWPGVGVLRVRRLLHETDAVAVGGSGFGLVHHRCITSTHSAAPTAGRPWRNAGSRMVATPA